MTYSWIFSFLSRVHEPLSALCSIGSHWPWESERENTSFDYWNRRSIIHFQLSIYWGFRMSWFPRLVWLDSLRANPHATGCVAWRISTNRHWERKERSINHKILLIRVSTCNHRFIQISYFVLLLNNLYCYKFYVNSYLSKMCYISRV